MATPTEDFLDEKLRQSSAPEGIDRKKKDNYNTSMS
jgi:hypothetical protein